MTIHVGELAETAIRSLTAEVVEAEICRRGHAVSVLLGTGEATIENDFNELVYTLPAGAHDITCSSNNMYISEMDITTEIVSVSGTIFAAGWSTFSSSYPLDLSSITGGTAYYASDASGATVTFTSIEAVVRAGEGLMIKGTDGDEFTIDVANSGTAISGNLLVGVPSGGTVAADDNNYVFGWFTNPAEDFGFYFVNNTAPTLAAGKAYLHTAAALSLTPGAPAIIRVVDDATNIKNIESKEDVVKFIENGKLFIKKNGIVYDVLGRVIR